MRMIGTVFIVLAWVAPGALAQEPGSDPVFNPAATINLDFSGGNAEEYIKAVRTKADNANIITVGEVGLVNLSPLTLKSVTVEAALALLEDVEQQHPSGRVALSVNRIAPGGGSALPVYKVTARVEGKPARTISPESSVVSLAQTVNDEVQAEDILTAIETALELYGDTLPEASLRYHPETQLLIMRAHPEQINAIRAVVSELTVAQRDIQNEQEQRTRSRAEAQLEHQLALEKSQVAALHAKAQEFHGKTELLQHELDSQRAQRERLEVEMQRRMADYIEQIAELKAKLASEN